MVILGIDEVGRGCLAGPMVLGAVILDTPIAGLKDSKLLSKTKRQKFEVEIKLMAKAWALGWVSASEIDDLGLTAATTLAIERALEQIDVSYDQIIIDGSINYLPNNSKAVAMIKADNLIPAASAASILAKCARDDYMNQVAKTYPNYGFDKHVGYGTKQHLDSIKVHGSCELHRLSFKPLNTLGATL